MAMEDSTSKPKLVIDTNVLITTINRKNPEFNIYKAFERKAFDWIVSTEILTEYAEQLTSFYSEATTNLVLDVLCTATNVIFAEPFYRWGIRDCKLNCVKGNKY